MADTTLTPAVELWKTDHGIDGKDATRSLVARFTSKAKAIAYLSALGHTHVQSDGYWDQDQSKRHTMGAISFEIREPKAEVPLDPQPQERRSGKDRRRG